MATARGFAVTILSMLLIEGTPEKPCIAYEGALGELKQFAR